MTKISLKEAVEASGVGEYVGAFENGFGFRIEKRSDAMEAILDLGLRCACTVDELKGLFVVHPLSAEEDGAAVIVTENDYLVSNNPRHADGDAFIPSYKRG